MKLLEQRPSKDEFESKYVCGATFTGGWATRLEKYKKFISTTTGKYILELEAKLKN